VLDQAREAFIAMDAVGLVIDWNVQAQRTFGWSAEEAIGRTVAELIIPPRYRAAHTRGLRAYLDGGHAKMLDRRVELSAVDRTGRGFPIELTISRDATVDGSDPRFFAFLHDISDRRLSERLLRAQHAVTRVFAETQHSSEVLRGLLAALGAAMGWQLGAAWSSEDARDVLCCRSVWRSDSRLAADFEAVTLKLELASGVGLAGCVWASGEPAWMAGVPADPSFRRARVLTRGDAFWTSPASVDTG
jgi:PAS domain S-box-containing protein